MTGAQNPNHKNNLRPRLNHIAREKFLRWPSQGVTDPGGRAL
jgi:hypothetical protein